MERLTQQDGQGNWSLKGVKWEQLHVGQPITQEVREKLYGALWKLMEYEDTGMSPEEVEELRTFDGSQAMKATTKLQEEQSKHRWIPVQERLPAPHDRVLMYRPCMENAETGAISVQWGWAYKDASHWMPVPGAPENTKKGDW